MGAMPLLRQPVRDRAHGALLRGESLQHRDFFGVEPRRPSRIVVERSAQAAMRMFGQQFAEARLRFDVRLVAVPAEPA